MKYALIALLAMLVVPAVSEAKTRVSIGIGISGGHGHGGYYYGGYYGRGYDCSPRYAPPVVVYQPAPPVVYYSAPVYTTPPTYYAPAPVYYYSAPRTYYRGGYSGRYCR